jgi:hypothetical protein
MPSKSSSRTLDLPATIEEDLSYSGFYCTLDLEQKTGLIAAKIQKSGQKHCLSYPRHEYGASDEQGGAR